MNYSTLKVAELQALCKERNLKTSRTKSEMIERLEAYDVANELISVTEELGLYYSVPASQPVPDPEPETTSPRAGEGRVWLSDGRLFKAYEKEDRWLNDDEHEENLRDVVEEAVLRGKDFYGPPFRVDSTDVDEWIYAINIR